MADMEAVKTKNLSKTSSATNEAGALKSPGPPPPSPGNWLQSLEEVVAVMLKTQGREKASSLLAGLAERLRADGLEVPQAVSTPYINTIPVEQQPAYPGN